MVVNKEPTLEATVVVPPNSSVKGDYLQDLSIFGGSKHYIVSQNFQGGKCNYVFGGGTLDFSQAKLAPGRIRLKVNAAFGGVKIKVPRDWDVQIENSINIFGKFSDRRRDIGVSVNSESALIIIPVFIFGGGKLTTVPI